MTKGELQELVAGMPGLAEDEEIDNVEDLVRDAIDLQYLLLMRAGLRLRDSMARRHGVRKDPDEDEEDWT